MANALSKDSGAWRPAISIRPAIIGLDGRQALFDIEQVVVHF
jgi:hypothetical protein